MSAVRLDALVTGKRGSVARATNGGNKVSRVKNSGFGRSGAVHVRMYTSVSLKSRPLAGGLRANRSSSSALGVIGVRGSSAADDPEVEKPVLAEE